MIRILPNSGRIGPECLPHFRASDSAKLVCALLWLVAPPIWGQDFAASTFVMRNYSPFSALIGVPGRWPDGTNTAAELSWNISNHSLAAVGTSESLLLDGETHTLTARMQHRFFKRFEAGVEIPWIHHSGGFLDGAIDAWHEAFGLSEGIRPNMPNDDLRYLYTANNGIESVRFEDSSSGFGDLRLAAAFDLGSIDAAVDAAYLSRMPVRLTLHAKAPTGNVEKLTGSGHADFAAGLGVRSPPGTGSRFHWWLDAGIVWPGAVDIAGLDTKAQVFYYDAAIAWRALGALDVLLEIAGNSALYRSELESLGEPVAQLAFGGLWHTGERFGLRFGLFEDIRTHSAPDFGLELTLVIKGH